jgi:glycine/D-amino acid oxidase-like deaminating enzyme
MHAPATGKILSDLILRGKTEVVSGVEVLNFERFAKGSLLHETAVL